MLIVTDGVGVAEASAQAYRARAGQPLHDDIVASVTSARLRAVVSRSGHVASLSGFEAFVTIAVGGQLVGHVSSDSEEAVITDTRPTAEVS
jgi:hypothetical protein